MSNDLLVTIQSAVPSFSKGQKRIAQFILEHYDKAAFMTASRLGQTVGVSESTVVRFASELGYEGYPQLQKALQGLIRNRLTSVQRMELTTEQLGNDGILQKVLGADIDRIRHTLDLNTEAAFSAAVDSIVAARRVYIVGVRSSRALAEFLYFYMHLLTENVQTVGGGSLSELFEQLLWLGEEDVVIGISFPRSVSYTHLDVYKRQICTCWVWESSTRFASKIRISSLEETVNAFCLATHYTEITGPVKGRYKTEEGGDFAPPSKRVSRWLDCTSAWPDPQPAAGRA